MLKTKRTYNLSRRAIKTVQALAERRIAPTQDALVADVARELVDGEFATVTRHILTRAVMPLCCNA